MNVIRAVKQDELRAALTVLLAKPDTTSHELHRQIDALMRYASKTHLSLEHCFVAEEGGRIVSSCLCVDSAGRNASVFLPNHLPTREVGDCVVAMLEQLACAAERRGIQLLQGMTAPEALVEKDLFAKARFQRLTELIYLERDVTLPIPPRISTPEVSWEEYTASNHAEFAKVVQGTYEDSLDCAALSGVRDIEDTLASHRATGEFIPRYWFLARAHGEPIGVGLFARLTERSATEVVYMGLLPAARGHGYGMTLLRRALSVAREQGMALLTLTVDERNAPARRLYAAFGFHESSRRDVWMRILSSST